MQNLLRSIAIVILYSKLKWKCLRMILNRMILQLHSMVNVQTISITHNYIHYCLYDPSGLLGRPSLAAIWLVFAHFDFFILSFFFRHKISFFLNFLLFLFGFKFINDSKKDTYCYPSLIRNIEISWIFRLQLDLRSNLINWIIDNENVLHCERSGRSSSVSRALDS